MPLKTRSTCDVRLIRNQVATMSLDNMGVGCLRLIKAKSQFAYLRNDHPPSGHSGAEGAFIGRSITMTN